MKKDYLSRLTQLRQVADGMPNTPLMARGKIAAVVCLHLRYEKLMLDRNLSEHPYHTVANLIADTVSWLSAWKQIAYAEAETQAFETDNRPMEVGHKDLFQQLWVN